jgi:hypothetical protein
MHTQHLYYHPTTVLIAQATKTLSDEKKRLEKEDTLPTYIFMYVYSLS